MRTHRKSMTRPAPFWRFDNDFARLFEPGGFMLPALEGDEALATDWRPAIDVSERDKEYLVRADLPGVDAKDIDVTLEDGMLTVRGERKEERREDDEGFHRVERFSGSFFRRVAMPDAAEDGKVKARFDKGVLEITVPKGKVHSKRRIEIES